MGFLSRQYVCFALPMYNVGIYAVIGEIFVVALVTGILSVAAPDIIAVSIPGFGAPLLGALCIILAVFQIWGVICVRKEYANQFKRYTNINIAGTTLLLLLALIWIIISAVNHNSAVNACMAQFLAPNQTDTVTGTLLGSPVSSSQSQSGHDVCNVFMYVQIGIMVFLWILIALSQTYFLAVEKVYASEQRSDHVKYNSIYSSAGEEIALRRSGLWDPSTPRTSTDEAATTKIDNAPPKGSGLRNEYRPEDSESELIPPSLYKDPYNNSYGPRPGPSRSHADASSYADYVDNPSYQPDSYPPPPRTVPSYRTNTPPRLPSPGVAGSSYSSTPIATSYSTAPDRLPSPSGYGSSMDPAPTGYSGSSNSARLPSPGYVGSGSRTPRTPDDAPPRY